MLLAAAISLRKSNRQWRISQNEWLISFRLRSSLRFNKIINFKTSFLKDSSKFLKFIWILFLPKKREKFHLQPNKNYSSRFRQIRYKQIFSFSEITNFHLHLSNTNPYTSLTQFDLFHEPSLDKFIKQISYSFVKFSFKKGEGDKFHSKSINPSSKRSKHD